MDFRVILSGEQTISLFEPPVIPLKPGDKFSRTGSNMIAFYSDKQYTKACIKFEDEVYTAAGESKKRVCNTFNVYKGGPMTVTTGGGGAGGGSGGITINPNI
jgi:hypothetical protein